MEGGRPVHIAICHKAFPDIKLPSHMKYVVLLSRMVALFQCNICVTRCLAEERTACNCITEKLGSTKGYTVFVARLCVCSVDVKCLQFLHNSPLNLVTNHLVIKYPL